LENLRLVPYDDKMKACVFEGSWCVLFTGHYNEQDWVISRLPNDPEYDYTPKDTTDRPTIRRTEYIR
jgi:hypothetical protein